MSKIYPVKPATAENPVEPFLRMDRMPSIWCPSCGIGTTVNCFARALTECGLNLDKVAVVSGIGCTGRVAGYVNLDSFHTTHGRPVAFATGLKLANPELKLVVYSGDGDLFAIGGNHFIHAARRNIDMTVVCVNNHTYGMTGGQVTPTTPGSAVASTTPYGAFEQAFSLPYVADSCGAVYVARWTTYHVRQVAKAMREALLKPGFSFIEIIAPCPTLYARRNKLGDGLEAMRYYKEKSVIKNGADTREVGIGFQEEIICGKFVDRERPTWIEGYNSQHQAILGDKFKPYPTGQQTTGS
jgi:2-oxoglutarate ferredoxin oxidoreductase subunit beta